MQRLSGLDASFLYTETPTLHMHTLKIGIVDVHDVPGGYSFERFVEVLAERLHLLPPFRRRPVAVPYGLHHPVWIEDADFDIRLHLRRMTAAAPGGPRELDAAISTIASTQLPRDRPLWEICVVEGLADERVGFVAKLHHAAADGVAASQLLANIMELTAEERPAPPVVAPWQPERAPARRDLLTAAGRDLVTTILRLPLLIVRTLRRLTAVVRTRRNATDVPPVMFQGPRTSFNGPLTARRAYASITLDLDDFRDVKSSFSCTINDVVLAVVTGAVRDYLLARGEPVERPLVAAVPVSSDAPDAVRLMGNRTSNMFTGLPVHLDGPVERLETIRKVTATAKSLQNALGVETMEQWVEYSPPAAYRLIWRVFVPRVKRPPVNCIVSNVPGPRDPLYIAGAKLVGLQSVGPLLEGVGLNVTVWSYLRAMHCSVLCCPDTLPDPHAITDGIARALAELQKCARSVR